MGIFQNLERDGSWEFLPGNPVSDALRVSAEARNRGFAAPVYGCEDFECLVTHAALFPIPLENVKGHFVGMTNPDDFAFSDDMARGKIPESRLQASARRFKAVRLALGLSQTEIAKATGIDVKTINNWERAVSEPEITNAFRLLDVYGITLEYTFRGDLKGLPYEIITELGKDNTKRGKASKE